ncbi:MAG: hypothetical protein V3S69_03560 [Dehalococcoidales bacterium]
MLAVEDKFKFIQRASSHPIVDEASVGAPIRSSDTNSGSARKSSPVSSPRSAGKQKKCAKCAETKPVEGFPTRDDTSDGYASYCKTCRNELNKQRRLNSVTARLKHHIYSRVAKQYEGRLPENATKNLETYLGYSIASLARSLEAGVREDYGITLKQSFTRNFHLDHIHPLKEYRVEELGDQYFQDCWAVDNLKMIPAELNLKKGSKVVTYEELESG